MKKAVLIFSCVALLFGSLSAQDWKGKGRFIGLVLDEANVPLQGVKVKLVNAAANAGFEVVTDKEGKFTAAWLRKGAWNVDFEKFGYEIKKIALDITEVAKNPDVKVILKKSAGLTISDDLKKELLAANALYEEKNYQGALDGYNGILVKNPDAYIIYKNVGNCYFAMEQYEKAEEAFLKVLAKDATNADAMVQVGNTYANRNLNDKALEWYNKIEIEKITDSTVLLNIGINYLNVGKTEEALKNFKQAVKVNPNDLDAIYRLGVAYISVQNNVDAVAMFDAYLKLDPDSERATTVKGFLEYLKKK
jgi:tetratricopeptide (TPR) repeat protein